MFDTRSQRREETESIVDRLERRKREAADARILYWEPRDFPSIRYPSRYEALWKLINTVGLSKMSETVVIYALGRKDVQKEVMTGNALRWMIDGLEERFGGIDERPDPTTDRMREAERTFLTVIADEYKAGELETVREETVNIHEWARAHGVTE